MIDAIEVTEEEIVPVRNKFGTRKKTGTISDRTSLFFKLDKKVSVIAAIAFLATLIGWIANAANLVTDVNENKKDILKFKQYIIDNSAREARIDERTEMIEKSNDRIEKYLIGRGR